jgi:hypothetical protein
MADSNEQMAARILAVLPAGWFAEAAPVLGSVLAGLAATWTTIQGMIETVGTETRVASVTGSLLDLAASDFLGNTISRRNSEADAAFRTRVQAEMVRERGTRAALISALTDLTGQAPVVFEPARTTDTGGWSGGGTSNGFAYGMAGGWGSLALPFQAFVTALRPQNPVAAGAAGWNGGCGYGAGPIEYAAGAVTGPVSDAAIYAAAAAVMPANGIAWMKIVS